MLSSSGQEVPALRCSAASACSLFLPISCYEVASNTSASQHVCLISHCLSLSQSVSSGREEKSVRAQIVLLITYMEESDWTACLHSDPWACGHV